MLRATGPLADDSAALALRKLDQVEGEKTQALRQGEVLWHWWHFVCDARGSLYGLLGRMCNVANRVAKSDYLSGARGISGARRGGQMVQHDGADCWEIQEW